MTATKQREQNHTLLSAATDVNGKKRKKERAVVGNQYSGCFSFTLKRMHTTEETGLHTLRVNEVIWSACMCSHTWAGPEGAHVDKKGLSSFWNENVCIIFLFFMKTTIHGAYSLGIICVNSFMVIHPFLLEI